MYIHTTEAASLLEISSRRLRKLLQEGRVVGAYKSGKFWLIPLHNGMPVIKKAKRGQPGTWKEGVKPPKSIVHINKNVIQQNIKKRPEERQPVIGIKTSDPASATDARERAREGAQLGYVHHLEIPAPCRIVYSPDKPLPVLVRVPLRVERAQGRTAVGRESGLRY